MSWRPFFASFWSTLFILYCVEAGVFLVLVPWREVWARIVASLPYDVLQSFLVLPIGRGAVTGLGLIHLVWGAHDLQRLLLKRPGTTRTNPS